MTTGRISARPHMPRATNDTGTCIGDPLDRIEAIVPDAVLLSRQVREEDGITVARHRFRPVEVTVPTLVTYAVSLHLNGPNRVVQWRDGHTEEWIEHPGEIAIRVPGGSPFVQAALAVSEDINLLLDPTFVRAVAADIAPAPGIAAPADVARLRDPRLEWLLRALALELESGGLGGRLYIDAVATAVTVLLLRRDPSAHGATRAALTSVPGARLSQTEWRRVADYIEANLPHRLGLLELAAIASRSPRHFTRLFRAVVGMSPHQYVIQRRVERAKALLTNTDLPIAQVAVEVGFAHQSHLAAHFRRLVGATPARYRR